jgi:hypothetical protein
MEVLLQERYRVFNLVIFCYFTGLVFEEGGNFWDSIVGIRIVTNFLGVA